MRRKNILYASGVFFVCIVMMIGYFAFLTDKNVTVYDDNFKILDYIISTGTTHTIYNGNQTVGRVRAILKNRLGLNFINLPPAAVMKTPKIRAFLVRYEVYFPLEELDGLTAVLTNGKNISKELPGGNMPFPAEPTFVGYYIIPALPMSDDSFRIDLRLKSADDPVASFRVGKIYRHNRGADSGK